MKAQNYWIGRKASKKQPLTDEDWNVLESQARSKDKYSRMAVLPIIGLMRDTPREEQARGLVDLYVNDPDPDFAGQAMTLAAELRHPRAKELIQKALASKNPMHRQLADTYGRRYGYIPVP